MKGTSAALFFFISSLCHAQRIQVIVPKQTVEGNAFQIQYVITGPSGLADITNPSFEGLQIVAGPNHYEGSSLVNGQAQQIENITYTVVPLKTGIIKIDPLIVKFKNGEEEKSDEKTISVNPQPNASFNAQSTYTDVNLYAPTSKTNLNKLIAANLFIKTEVDRRTCFLGEVITATFKLYSRLQSTSEVINSPSLYGFSVMDMLDINEAHQAVETIDGKVFNTSILRKMQLYPTQTGRLTIDQMLLRNTIEFNDSVTGKKIKIEKMMASNPVDVTVKDLPSKQPAGYTGAVGQFAISASLQRSKIEANAQGNLVLTISGRGNFIQFSEPAINWPRAFDVFDPILSDELNKNAVPLEGKRKYMFRFVTDRVDTYSIPPVSFSFFDAASGKFKQVSTDSVRVEIIPSTTNHSSKEKKHRLQTTSSAWKYFLITIVLLASAFVVFKKKETKEKIAPLTKQRNYYLQRFDDIASRNLAGKQFCLEIQKLLFQLTKEYHLSLEQKQAVQALQNDCQLFAYSDINTKDKIDELQKRTEQFLKQVQG